MGEGGSERRVCSEGMKMICLWRKLRCVYNRVCTIGCKERIGKEG